MWYGDVHEFGEALDAVAALFRAAWVPFAVVQ